MLSKKGYCANRTEVDSDMGGKDIASTFSYIFEQVIKDHPLEKNITTWSESCVPQKRNSYMSFTLNCVDVQINTLNPSQ